MVPEELPYQVLGNSAVICALIDQLKKLGVLDAAARRELQTQAFAWLEARATGEKQAVARDYIRNTFRLTGR